MANDPLDFSNKYNTPLTKKQEEQFLKWATKENKINDVYDYDLRGAWKALNAGQMSPDDRGHLGDMFKKPNHPTFSDQSVYHGTDGYFGGSWLDNGEGGYLFKAPVNHLWHPEALQDYFQKYEPDARLMFTPKPTTEIVNPFQSSIK